MKTTLRKALALLLCLCMCLSLVPAAFAEDDGIVGVDPLIDPETDDSADVCHSERSEAASKNLFADMPGERSFADAQDDNSDLGARDGGIVALDEEPADIELIPDEAETPDDACHSEWSEAESKNLSSDLTEERSFAYAQDDNDAQDDNAAQDDSADFTIDDEEKILIPGGIRDDETFAAGNIAVNEENFPDDVFRAYVAGFDKDGDGLSEEEIAGVKTIDISQKGIESLKGIEFFTALTRLFCASNRLTSLDVGNNSALSFLSCSSNRLTSLDVGNNTALSTLNCNNNRLTSLNVSSNAALSSLYCTSNQLTSLDVGNNTALTTLSCYDNQLTSLNVGNNTALATFNCSSNQLTSLDVGNNTALTTLSCYNNQLTSLNVGNNTALSTLNCSSNQLSSLDVSNNPALIELSCVGNQLASLDVSNNTFLTSLSCERNQLTSLKLSYDLQHLECYNNALNSLDISGCETLLQLIENNDPYFKNNTVRYGGRENDWSLNDVMIHFDKTVTLITGQTSPAAITFDANGGTGEMEPQPVTKYCAETLNQNAFTRAGFAFKGWNTAADGTGSGFKDGDTINTNRDRTLYAQWVSTTCTVHFEPNGGSGSMDNQTIEKNTSTKLNANTFVSPDEQLVFDSWNTKPDGSGSAFKNQATVRVSKDITLYAQWASRYCAVRFDPNGGSGSMDDQTVEKNVAVKLHANAFTAPENMRFGGWNTKADGSGSTIKDQATVRVSKDITLYALWTPSILTVTWTNDDGTEILKTEQHNAPYTPAWTDAEPVKANNDGKIYIFDGWTIDGTTVYNNTAKGSVKAFEPLYADATFRAHFVESPHNEEYQRSLSLADSIAVRWRISKTAEGADPDKYSAVVTYKGQSTTYASGLTSGIVLANCTAQEMTEEASVNVYYDGVLIAEDLRYSVNDYCREMIASAGMAVWHPVMQALQDYGYTAQKYYNSTNPLPDGNGQALAAAATAVPDTSSVKTANRNIGITNVTFRVFTEAQTTLSIGFWHESGRTADMYTFTLVRDGEITTVAAEDIYDDGSLFEIRVRGIAAKDLGKEIEVYAADKNNGSLKAIFRGSAVSYMSAAWQNSNDAKLKAMVLALYNYYKQADARQNAQA